VNAAYMLEAVAYCEKGNGLLYVVEADFVVQMGKSFEVCIVLCTYVQYKECVPFIFLSLILSDFGLRNLT